LKPLNAFISRQNTKKYVVKQAFQQKTIYKHILLVEEHFETIHNTDNSNCSVLYVAHLISCIVRGINTFRSDISSPYSAITLQ